MSTRTFVLLLAAVAAFAQSKDAVEEPATAISVLTNRYDNLRTGLNSHERVLTTSNVNSQTFGKLYSYLVDGSVFAQPLYVPNVAIPGQGTHNVLYVCTMNDTVYAFDAETNTTLWSVNFTNSAGGVTPVPISDITGSNSLNIVGFVGIESTPVINASTGTMYLLVRTKEVTTGATNYVQRLHAIDITTGAEKFGGPVAISASVPGSGEQSSGGLVPFNPLMNNQRSALALANGKVILAWASHEDDQPYHGWVMAYDETTLAQVGAFCTTPNGIEGGVWMSGRGPVVDTAGNVYYFTGNGSTDHTKDYSEAALKFNTKTGLALVDFFVASNFSSLNAGDVDLGSSGPLMLPGVNMLVGGGKQGVFYLLNPSKMGHEVAGDTQIPQKFQVTGGEIKPGPAYWQSASKGPLVYLWGEQDTLNAWHFNGTNFDTSPLMQSSITTPPGAPGATISVSANGSTDGTGIVWASMAVSQDADHGIVAGMLRAMNASDVTHELWNSLQVQSRDDTGIFAKFVPPMVVNGKVYMASFSDYSSPNYVNVYGLLPSSKKFTLSIMPNAATVLPGGTVSYTVSVNAEAGHRYSGTVAVRVTGVPAGAMASLSSASITGTGSAVLTVATSSGMALGSAEVGVSGTSSGVTHRATATLNVSDTATAISLNFVGSGTALGSTEIAGVVAKANWNNLTGLNTSASLVDENGSGTSASATWTGDNPWSLPVANTPANFTMMQGYLDDGNANTITITVSGLPVTPNGYSIYVYADGDNGGATRNATYTLTESGYPSTALTLSDAGGQNFSGTFTQVTASNTLGNYMVFPLHGGAFTLTATPTTATDGTLRAPVNGIQIIPE